MRRATSAVVGLLACLPLALLAIGVPVPWLTRGDVRAKAKSVPDGDRELAWLHTTTNASTWERFVTGVQRATLSIPGLAVDDAGAFPEGPSAVPELVLTRPDVPGALRIRWYKLSNDATHADWVRVLAERNPPPLAVIGGGSSDRARDLATAMAARTRWAGERPLLFLSTATADAADPNDLDEHRAKQKLVDVYDDRTFRFCFTNRQMAEATVDFVWSRPDLAPGRATAPAVGGGAAAAAADRPLALFLDWLDDPYSVDLRIQFFRAITAKTLSGAVAERVRGPSVPFSVGGFHEPNRYERAAADFVVNELRTNPGRRVVLVLPTVGPAARRVLRIVCRDEPDAGTRLVVVNGDGISTNVVYRDGDVAWPDDTVPVPLVLFAHANPVGWDDPTVTPPAGSELKPPTATDDVLLFAEIATVAVTAAIDGPGFVSGAEAYRSRIRNLFPATFNRDGNRAAKGGEYAVVVRPRTATAPATIDVWRHRDAWEPVRTLERPPRPAPGRVE
jgi:hypothetical protein